MSSLLHLAFTCLQLATPQVLKTNFWSYDPCLGLYPFSPSEHIISAPLCVSSSQTPFSQLVSLLITFLTSGEPSWHGYLYCALLLLSGLTNTILSANIFYFQVLRLHHIPPPLL